jgi:hypothetical protein
MKLSVYLFCLISLIGCKDKFKFEDCLVSVSGNEVLCIDERLKELPKNCTWFDEDESAFQCDLNHIEGYRCTNLNDSRRLSDEYNQVKADLKECQASR